ncbi:MAG: hypothetical protein J0L70_18220 [Leptolyngbya sp. UWPOB_LEPTO1]|uniref:hypothetical protein n=1 Tax=Leptolyngbya sp. UWPOB_LEPTO1 TaxID=2815653 RepID=UPI001AD067A8|nr:hypothetical protein [Leptolyngbya sp. UWPOB_LEPTO1]MBN8562471.1 hypothetical protein [Leptolyngbya sp. UWPOB_LEPTO1]
MWKNGQHGRFAIPDPIVLLPLPVLLRRLLRHTLFYSCNVAVVDRPIKLNTPNLEACEE